jgi:Tfp pilus assembly protein PilO
MIGKGKGASRGMPRSWLITGIVAASAIAYVFLVFLPGQRSIQAVRSQLNERRQQILQADALIGPLTQAARRLDHTRQVNSEWQAAAPSHTRLTEKFASLSAAATQSGVTIVRFDPQPPQELQLLALHGLVVQFQGDFAQVFDFLRRIEALPGTIWMPTLRISADSHSGKTLSGELTLTIFVDRADYSD